MNRIDTNALMAICTFVIYLTLFFLYIMNRIDANALMVISTFVIGLTQFLLWRYIARQKSYESEKGKNLATQEDIKKITDKIESVKASYNESLERHKIELQKEFESHKYILKLCQSVDKELIDLLYECIAKEKSNGKDYTEFYEALYRLLDFLNIYLNRYGSNDILCKLKECIINTKISEDVFKHNYKLLEPDNEIKTLLNRACSIFLPELREK